ncbi:MAG TPA: MlaE family lipid ABC transporter permease subunit [Woeseiaceae bacterium]|nr:MlaE family lipid ABC transporter permease subunit [Woeseiaceae bacterium]
MTDAATLSPSGDGASCAGRWTARHVDELWRRSDALRWPDTRVALDVAAITRMDAAGAWLLHGIIERLRRDGKSVHLAGADARVTALLELVAEHAAVMSHPPHPPQAAFLEHVGRHAHAQWHEYRSYLGFVGRTSAAAARAFWRPRRLRVSLLAKELQSAGLNALPIVGLLAFLMGVVIAYQGGIVLADYGASIYVADIVGLSMVRELAPLITAIIVAGRTGSAYTAQIGTMVVTEEIDALRSIGIPPLDVLVLPKLLALVIALPLLTVFADLLGLFGGLVMSNSMLGLNSATYLNRLAEALTLDSYLSGIGKAPVFACIIASVGCFQGFQVSGSAESVGRQTTVSVVQSIFLVLIVDAVFSVAFSKLGI